MTRPFGMLVVAVALASGCAGASIEVTAERAGYPLSMSDHVRDSAGVLHGRHSLDKVGELNVSGTRVGLLYSLVTLLPTYDISDEVNSQVSAARGEAVIDLVIKVPVTCDLLNAFPLVSLLPLWPGCVNVQVTGDIVRRKVPAPAPPAPPAAPPPSSNGPPPILSDVPPGGAGPTRS